MKTASHQCGMQNRYVTFNANFLNHKTTSHKKTIDKQKRNQTWENERKPVHNAQVQQANKILGPVSVPLLSLPQAKSGRKKTKN